MISSLHHSQHFVWELLETSSDEADIHKRIWLGIRRFSLKKVEWIDGTSTSFSNWEQGRPSGNGNCAEIHGEGIWDTRQCNDEAITMCQRKSRSLRQVANECPDGWTYLEASDSFYRHIAYGLDFFEAVVMCENHNATLPIVQSEEENRFISSTPYGSDWTWLGLRRNSGKEYEWTDDSSTANFSNWGPGEPKGDGNCVQLLGSTSSWFDYECHSTSVTTSCQKKRISRQEPSPTVTTTSPRTTTSTTTVTTPWPFTKKIVDVKTTYSLVTTILIAAAVLSLFPLIAVFAVLYLRHRKRERLHMRQTDEHLLANGHIPSKYADNVEMPTLANDSGIRDTDESRTILLQANVGLFAASEIAKTNADNIEIATLASDSGIGHTASFITIGDEVGQGFFGKIYKARIRNIKRDVMDVAAKMGKDAQNEQLLMEEAKQLADISPHQNILFYISTIRHEERKLLLTEFCDFGDLRNFLTKKFHGNLFHSEIEIKKDDEITYMIDQKAPFHTDIIRTTHLVCFALQIAWGMHHLHQQKCLHRDLAARNVLLTNRLIAKIADFGLTRMTDEQGYYKLRRTAIPIPKDLTAPEVWETGKWSEKCDSWAFGVALSDIFSLCCGLYSKSDESEGACRPRGRECYPEIYEKLISRCLDMDKSRRPDFQFVADFLRAHIATFAPRMLDSLLNEVHSEGHRIRELVEWCKFL